MHIDNVTVNITWPANAEHALSALRAFEPATPVTAANVAAIGEIWPGQGGIYAGLSRGEDGQPDAHLVLHVGEPTGKLAWQDALDWTGELEVEGHNDFRVPTRYESALLYANLRDLFDHDAWYWTSTQYSADNAFIQDFSNGVQTSDGKEYEGRVRAVRRFAA